MKRLMLATVAGAALLTGVSAASAQTFQSYGPDYYAYRGPMVERGVGLQIGPVGIYAGEPAYGYYEAAPSYYGSAPTDRKPGHSTYNSRAFQSQEIWPQSPPTGS